MLLASCGTEIKFHKWPSGDYYGSYQIPEAGFCIPSISWCNEGQLLVTTVPSLGPPIVISVGESGIQTYQVIDVAQIQSATFSRAMQKNIAFGTESGQVLIYDVNQKCTLEHLPLLPSAIKYLEYGAQDTTLAAGCKNGQICLYNSNYNVSATFYVPNCNSLSAMACHSKLPHLLAAASVEGIVVVWDTTTGKTKFLDKSHTASTTGVAFSATDSLASVGLDEKFIGYDLRTRECTFCSKTNDQLSAVAFMPGGDQIAVGTIDGKLFCYDARSISHPLYTIVAHHPKAVGRIAFQNLPLCEEPTSNAICEILQHETFSKKSKSNLTTTVVYNKSRPQSYLHTEASVDSLTQHPSTINTIIPDTDSEFVVPNSEEYTTYLENLQYNTTENRGNDANRMVGVDCLNLNEAKACPDVNRITDAINVLNSFPFTSSMSAPTKPSVEEDFDEAKNDAINNWIKKIHVHSSRSMNNITVLVDKDEDIVKLRKELQDVTKEAVEQLAEMINREFLKVRMAVSRGFVQMECKMNARWAEFNQALMKMTGYMSSDEPNELDAMKDVEESSNVLFPPMRLSTRPFSKHL